MRRICATIALLLSDERSAVARKAAVRFALIVLVIAASAVFLASLGDHAYRGADRRVLTASDDPGGRPLV